MTGLISIIHALQTSACYLRLGSSGTEVEQGRPLSQRAHRGLLAAGATSGQRRARWEVRVVAPRSCRHDRLLVSEPFLAGCQRSRSQHGRALPRVSPQKYLLTPTSSPRSLGHPPEFPAGASLPEGHGLCITDVLQIVRHLQVVCRFCKPAVETRAPQLDKIKCRPERGALLARKLPRRYWTAPSLLRRPQIGVYFRG